MPCMVTLRKYLHSISTLAYYLWVFLEIVYSAYLILYVATVSGKILEGEKMVNCEPFTNIVFASWLCISTL